MNLPPLPELDSMDIGTLQRKTREYGALCRKQALEEAAKACESGYDNWDNERPLRICATAIRELAK